MRGKWLHYFLPVIAGALWLAATLGCLTEERQLQPKQIAAMIAADLSRNETRFQAIEQHREEVKDWISGDAGTKSNWVFQQPFLLYAFKGDTLLAWNSSNVPAPSGHAGTRRLLKMRNGLFYELRYMASWLDSNIVLVALIPIYIDYPIANDYLKPHFAASDAIPAGTTITDTPAQNAAPIFVGKNNNIGFVHPDQAAATSHAHSGWINWCWALSLLAFCGWIHLMAARLSTKGHPFLSVLLIAGLVVIMRGLMYWRGLPFHLGDSVLFSPRLYATNAWLPSLGDLLLNTLAALWLVSGTTSLLPWRRWKNSITIHIIARFVIALAAMAALAAAAMLFVRLINSLVLDSLIPFDPANLSALDITSLTGLLIASMLGAILLGLTGLGGRLLDTLGLPWWSKAIAIIAGFTLMLLLRGRTDLLPLYCFVSAWILLFMVMRSFGEKGKTTGVFRPTNLLWSVAHCILLTLLLQHFIGIREIEARKNFAEHVASRHDDALEYNFSQVEPYLKTDTAIRHFLQHPAPSGRKALNERLATLYFNNSFSAYQANLYFFNADNKPLFNGDTASITDLTAIAKEEIPSGIAPDLFYLESATNDHIYLGIVPINEGDEELLGNLVIDLEQKKIVAETVLPELLQPATINKAEKSADYSYAVYVDNKLVAQTSDYPFAFYIAKDTTRREYYERKGNDFSTLIYTPDVRRTVYVWHHTGIIPQLLTLFSYLLLLRFMLMGIVRFFRTLTQWNEHPKMLHLLRVLSLRKRVQFSVMGIVFVSFLLIGAITVIFLRFQYANTNEDKRQAMMQSVSRSIQQYMKDENGTADIANWRQVMSEPRLKYFIGNLAASQKIDINLFDAQGRLAVASQQAIYDQGLLAPIMRPDILARMTAPHPKPLIMEKEAIGNLGYISCYTALRTEGGRIAGFLNVPLFYSQRELDEQISSVVVALINLYAIIFLLSSIMALVITRWITRAFDVIIQQFGRLALHGNEPLQWPYEDEIGLLVKEYNKMVKKVEENVALLARSEREGAWKEMARQVAHEIKNPLTPMSLNVQYLQRAIKSGQPNTEELALRTSESLLEQINNLSVIASEFADFARIGSRPEDVDLDELLHKVVDLYISEKNSETMYVSSGIAIHVMADRSQLVRIITNLMQNAVQSIPDDRKGMIAVRLHQEGTEAIIEVEDNGAGVSEEAQKKLFTPYFTTKSSGTGLGLAMTRQMVEVWGGTIDYKTVQDEGTTFIIRIPVHA